MAHTKSGGSTALGRDSQSKRLGVKRFGGQKVKAGAVLIRQRGTKFRAGANVRRGADDTFYAAIDGRIKFISKTVIRWNGQRQQKRVISVIP